MKKSFPRYPLVFIAFGLLVWAAAGEPSQETEIRKAKIYLETYPLLTETDLYCSFFIWEGPPPEMAIAGAERAEFIQFSDGDVVYLKAGRAQGVAAGQRMLIVSAGQVLSHPQKKHKVGSLSFRRGWISVLHADENSAAARIEKACGPVRLGDGLVPFETRPTVEGKDKGFVAYGDTAGLPAGTVIYLENDLNQVGASNWMLIDIGREQGLRVGQQLTIFKQPAQGHPRRSVGNGVLIDVQAETATLKILSSSDAVVLGDGVEVKAAEGSY